MICESFEKIIMFCSIADIEVDKKTLKANLLTKI